MRLIILVPFTLLLGGCFSYTTVQLDAVPQGARVSADLTTRGAADNEARLGNDVMLVEGTLARRSVDSLVLNVARTRTRGGSWVSWSGEEVSLGEGAVATLRERKFSIVRTAIATAGVAAAIVVSLTTDLVGGGDEGASTDPKGRPNPGGQ